MSNESALVAVAGFFMLFFFVIFFLYVIPAIITMVRLYVKAGKPGWAVIVPVYSSVVEAEIGKKPAWMGWLTGSLLVVSNILTRSSDDSINAIGSLVGLAAFVFGLILLIAFIKAYRASAGFWVAFFLLPIVAVFLVKNVSYGAETVAAPMAPGVPVPPVAPVIAAPVSQAPPVQPQMQPQPQFGDDQATAQYTTPTPQAEAPVAPTPTAYAPAPPVPVAPTNDPTNPTFTPPSNPVV